MSGVIIQYGEVIGTNRTAKTLAAPSGKTFPTVVSPPQPNLGGDALQFTTSNAIALTNVNANWEASAANSTDGGTNGKLWFQNQGQFTVEFFINVTTGLGGMTIIDWGTGGLAIGYRSGVGRLFFAISGVSFYFEPSATLVADTWYHIVLTREFVSGALRIYAWLDGTYLGTATSPNWTGTGDPTINRTADWSGYLQEFRISNIARYAPTVNFTPTTVPFVNDDNTLLLIHASSPIEDDNSANVPGGGITIEYGQQSITRTALTTSAGANGRVSTSQFIVGNSAYTNFSGNGFIRVSNASTLALGTGNFTIEGWFYLTSYGSGASLCYDARVAGTTVAPVLAVEGSNIGYAVGSSYYIQTPRPSLNTWTNVAVVRNGSTTTMYVGGNSVGSFTDNFNYVAPGDFIIGQRFDGGIFPFIGYIDEFRISSSARYTANYTPSTTAFINDANTILLLHMEGENGSTSFPDDNSPYLGPISGITIGY